MEKDGMGDGCGGIDGTAHCPDHNELRGLWAILIDNSQLTINN